MTSPFTIAWYKYGIDQTKKIQEDIQKYPNIYKGPIKRTPFYLRLIGKPKYRFLITIDNDEDEAISYWFYI